MTFKTVVFLLGGFFILAVGLGGAGAVEPDERLDDPVLEQRAREISQQLRCVVCQNQSIDESDAPLARDLRLIIRERLVEGDNDEQVIGFVVDRYGDFVLLKPPFQADTYLLWFGPFIIFLMGGLLIFYYFRKVLGAIPDGDNSDPGDREK
ncbi:MAG: cytochrome c-type biogenesis protein CcmH [Alphaproteobacteria bacterium]|nr:MAG: cytochrome c-type biogenesis protein CcmH [Alphaproteobacteria bacterium]